MADEKYRIGMFELFRRSQTGTPGFGRRFITT
jgi:hypothetical protein